MSDDSAGLPSRQSPRRRTDDVHVSDFTVMVRVPGKPSAVRVYIDAERDEAARYATESGGEVVPLPLSPVAGYTTGPHGSLIPIAPTEPVSDRVPGEASTSGTATT